jgi:hypothetical protein
LSGLHNDVWRLFHPGVKNAVLWQADWLPVIEFPWRVFFGAVTSFAIAVCFRSPRRMDA